MRPDVLAQLAVNAVSNHCITHINSSLGTWKSSTDDVETLSLKRPPHPYYAPEETLPAPLPTVDEIRDTGVNMNWAPDTAVAAVGGRFVVKYGPKVQLQEENMLFVKQATHFRVPTVYALFGDDGVVYSVTERVRGESLCSC